MKKNVDSCNIEKVSFYIDHIILPVSFGCIKKDRMHLQMKNINVNMKLKMY